MKIVDIATRRERFEELCDAMRIDHDLPRPNVGIIGPGEYPFMGEDFEIGTYIPGVHPHLLFMDAATGIPAMVRTMALE